MVTGALRTTHDPLADGAAIYVPIPDGLNLDGVRIIARIDPDDASEETDDTNARLL